MENGPIISIWDALLSTLILLRVTNYQKINLIKYAHILADLGNVI